MLHRPVAPFCSRSQSKDSEALAYTAPALATKVQFGAGRGASKTGLQGPPAKAQRSLAGLACPVEGIQRLRPSTSRALLGDGRGGRVLRRRRCASRGSTKSGAAQTPCSI